MGCGLNASRHRPRRALRPVTAGRGLERYTCIVSGQGIVRRAFLVSRICGAFLLRMRRITIRRGTHLTLGKDAPLDRAVQRYGPIVGI